MALMSKAAIVTGAAQGIGKAIAARLVKDGMRVAIVDINQEAAVAAAEELAGQYGADTMAVQCDVSQEEQVNTAVQKVLERFGTVDVLVNNAGILSLKKPFVEYTKADWDKIFGINFMGDVFFCKAVIPTMKEKKAGRIINMASQSALVYSTKGFFRDRMPALLTSTSTVPNRSSTFCTAMLTCSS